MSRTLQGLGKTVAGLLGVGVAGTVVAVQVDKRYPSHPYAIFQVILGTTVVSLVVAWFGGRASK